MGFTELLGVKIEKLKLNGNYSMEELYEKIKSVSFEAGTPSLVKNGFAWVIVFPQLDRNNQVQILGTKGNYSVQRAVQPAGVDKMAANMALDKLTGGLSGMSGAFGDTKKKCMELVVKTAETINALGI
ncbi:MAG TPA: hypothetical protein PLU43_04645 [Lachnospiraceae bacterium]|nr:hypothetical protein [Lachnospiraceae bacterium]